MPRTSTKKESQETIEIETTLPEIDKKITTKDLVKDISGTVDVISKIPSNTEKNRTNNLKVPLDQEIACKSVVFGGLTWVSPKTNAHYRWNDIGNVEYIPMADLITLHNTKREYLFKPLFIIEDPAAVEYFRLREKYIEVAQVNKLDELFHSDFQTISDTLDLAIRVNMRDIVISKVRKMRVDGVLNNIDIIRLLEKKLCFDLSDEK